MKDVQNVLNYYRFHADEIRGLEKKVHKKPSEKSVHKLRVASRRINSLNEIINREKNGELTKLVKKLGKLRDLDVGLENARKFGLDTDELEADRSKRKKQLINFSRKKNRKKLSFELVDTEKSLKKELNNLDQIVDDFFLDLADRFTEELDEDHLHKFRVALKKARYFLEALGAQVESLSEIQETLGQIHDLDVLMDKFGATDEILKVKEDLLKTLPELKQKCIDELMQDETQVKHHTLQ